MYPRQLHPTIATIRTGWMTEVRPTSLEIRLPPDTRLLRVLRLVGSGLASLGQLDLAATEEVRLAVDELGAALIDLCDGGAIQMTFELNSDAICVTGTTRASAGAESELDPMVDRLLAAVATSHEWSVVDDQVVARLVKLLPGTDDRAG